MFQLRRVLSFEANFDVVDFQNNLHFAELWWALSFTKIFMLAWVASKSQREWLL